MPSRSAKSIEGLKGVQIVKGDILKASDIEAAMDACDFVIHAAADTNVIPARSARQWRINYFGARNVLEAAQKNKKLKRLVLISSASSFGAGSRRESWR